MFALASDKDTHLVFLFAPFAIASLGTTRGVLQTGAVGLLRALALVAFPLSLGNTGLLALFRIVSGAILNDVCCRLAGRDRIESFKARSEGFGLELLVREKGDRGAYTLLHGFGDVLGHQSWCFGGVIGSVDGWSSIGMVRLASRTLLLFLSG